MPTIMIDLDGLQTLRDLHAEHAQCFSLMSNQLNQLRNELDLHVDAPLTSRLLCEVEEAAVCLTRQEATLRRLAEELGTYVRQVDSVDSVAGSVRLESIAYGWLERSLRSALQLNPPLLALREQLSELDVATGSVHDIVSWSLNGIVGGAAAGSRATIRQAQRRPKGFGDRMGRTKRSIDDNIGKASRWASDRATDLSTNVDDAAQRLYRETVDGLAVVAVLGTGLPERAARRGTSVARSVGRWLKDADLKTLMLTEAYSHRFGTPPPSDPSGTTQTIAGTIEVTLGEPPAGLEFKGSARIVQLANGDVEITMDGSGAGGLVGSNQMGGENGSGGSVGLDAGILGGAGRGATYRISGQPVNGRPAQVVFLEQYLLRLGLLSAELSGTAPFVAHQALQHMAPLPVPIRTETREMVVVGAEVACSMFGARTNGAASVEVANSTTFDKEKNLTRYELSASVDGNAALKTAKGFAGFSTGGEISGGGKASVTCIVNASGALQTIEIGFAGATGLSATDSFGKDLDGNALEGNLKVGAVKTWEHRTVVDVSAMTEAERQGISDLARAAATDPTKIDDLADAANDLADRYGRVVEEEGREAILEASVNVEATIKGVGVRFEGVGTQSQMLGKP